MNKAYIYKVNEYDWVAAYDIESASSFYVNYTGEYTDENTYELDEEEMNEKWFLAEEGVYGLREGTYTFQRALESALKNGWIPPFLFASTET